MIPKNPPPNIIPRYIPKMQEISENSIRPFIGHYIYVWMNNRAKVWFCPLCINKYTISGYAWYKGEWVQCKLSLWMIN
ncbi:MAG: hypothetical protein LBV08_08085, partial [Clostridiales bacterium]|nr:hypothetical protein [Clostridiales bacterium]